MYEIKLPQFEGPFDLLLFFIERDELDIHDIPISKITENFLDYIRHMKTMNIEMASEFIVVAATLMRIKARVLLPRKELNELGEEIDPRKELIDKLLEYKKFKESAGHLQLLEEERSKQFERGYTQTEMKQIVNSFSGEAELHTLTLYKLMRAFEKTMKRFEEEKNRPKHTVIQYPYTIEQQKENLMSLTRSEKNVPFEKLFAACENRIHAIFNFLGLLELIQQGLLAITIGETENQFWVTAPAVV
jgi:segregation and condensation protein A